MLNRTPACGSSTLRSTAGAHTATPTAPVGEANSPTPTVKVTQAPVARATVFVARHVLPIPPAYNCVSATLSINGSRNLMPLLQQINDDYQKLCPTLIISLGANSRRY